MEIVSNETPEKSPSIKSGKSSSTNINRQQSDNDQQIKYNHKFEIPLVWFTGQIRNVSFKIEELKEELFDRALRFVQKNHFASDYFHKHINLPDDARAEYLERVRFHLKNGVSLCAVNSDFKIIGVMVQRFVHKHEFYATYSRSKIVQHAQLKDVLNVSHALYKTTDVFHVFNCSGYVRIYFVCLQDTDEDTFPYMYESFLNASIRNAECLKASAIVGVFKTKKTQDIARKMGMKILTEIFYAKWLKNKQPLFGDEENKSVTLMGMPLAETERKPLKKTLMGDIEKLLPRKPPV